MGAYVGPDMESSAKDQHFKAVDFNRDGSIDLAELGRMITDFEHREADWHGGEL